MSDYSISKNDISNDSENIKLPLIDFKLIPKQKSINDISKNDDDNNNKLKYVKSETFITSKKTETARFEVQKPKTFINIEAIKDLLKEKIEVNNSLKFNNMIYKNFLKNNRKKVQKKNKINRYINEDVLKNSPIRITRKKIKLKHIKVGNIFTKLDEDEKSKNDEDSNYDLSLYNLRMENFINECKEAKRIKSVKKYNIKKCELKFEKSDWRKKINCALDDKYVTNKKRITIFNSLINKMNKSSKIYFDLFKTESNDMLQQIWSS